MKITDLENQLTRLKLENNEIIKTAIVDDFNDYEAGIVIKLFKDINKREASTIIKRFFREILDTKVYISFDEDYNGYLFDVEYTSMYVIKQKIKNTKNILIFSRKLANNGLYEGDKTFSKNILETYKIANSKEHHVELLEKIYPNYTILPIYTFEHSGMALELSPSCQFDNSADAFAAYKSNFSELSDKIKEINNSIMNY